jgi:predicted deacylase
MACGERVKSGTLVGLVHDFERIDAAPWEARAGVDGIVIAQAWGARVRQGQQVLVTGRELPWLD